MPQAKPQFVHLHVHSAYSLAEGAIHPKALVKQTVLNDMPAIAVTDTNNMFGALEFSMAAAEKGVQPIVGCQVEVGEAGQSVVLLAQNQAGYMNLSKIISDAYMDVEAQVVATTFDEVAACSDNLICLSGGQTKGFREEKDLLRLKEIFADRFYIELQRHGLKEEELHEEALIDIAYAHDIPLVATNDVYFASPDMHEAHDALLCIAEGRYISEPDRRQATKHHYLKSAAEMAELFADIPEAIQNTVVIAQRCSFLLKPIDPILPPFDTEGGRDEYEELAAQSEEGLKWRLENFVKDGDHDAYFARLKFELDTIKEMGFPGYFLIVSDFIKWAKEQDIPVGPGRGSGGGSVVAWALKITDLDPLELNLLFERFLNPERVSMPDFDIDFCQTRREEVIQYVQDKYGRDRVAQIITFGKLQARAVVRDVGRVLQMPYGLVDRIAKMIPNNPANPTTLQEALDADKDFRLEVAKDDLSEKLIDIALKLEGLYRHASTHAAGLVIGDRPLHELVPVYRDPRSDMPVTQFNMKYVEQAGLVKFDFLGLKTMTVIHRACQMIKETTGDEINILELPFDDEKTFEMLKVGNNIGVFQVESAGMRDLGKQIGISNLEELLAVIALFRPGPMENIPVYLENVKNEAEIDYMHEKLKPITQDTYGVMIYQEQVMQAAQVLAGYTLGGADLLRRAMGKKIIEEMDAQRTMFVKGANDNNQIPEEQANHIFDQIAAFAGYGFNKAHTAGYGLVSYWTAWLKANYPVQFMAASMTLDAGNTDKLSVFKQEIDRMGMTLLPPDINKSGVMFTVETLPADAPEDIGQGKAVRYALAALKGVGEGAMEKIIAERDENGEFKSLDDFLARLDSRVMNKRQFEGLISAGAFDQFGYDRSSLHGNSELLLRHAQSLANERESGQSSLFGGESSHQDMPPLQDVEAWDNLEILRYEFMAVGFYLSAHPLDTRMEQLEKLGVVSYANAAHKLDRQKSNRLHMAGILIRKQERVSAKSGKKFAFLQISDATGVFEVMIFSELLAACRDMLVAGTALSVTGHRIEPLDEAVAKKLRDLKIHIDASEPVQRIYDALQISGDGNVKITIFAHTASDHIAEISVRGLYTIPPDMMTVLQKTPGFLKFSEN